MSGVTTTGGYVDLSQHLSLITVDSTFITARYDSRISTQPNTNTNEELQITPLAGSVFIVLSRSPIRVPSVLEP